MFTWILYSVLSSSGLLYKCLESIAFGISRRFCFLTSLRHYNDTVHVSVSTSAFVCYWDWGTVENYSVECLPLCDYGGIYAIPLSVN